MPPAFVLSQDQTLMLILSRSHHVTMLGPTAFKGRQTHELARERSTTNAADRASLLHPQCQSTNSPRAPGDTFDPAAKEAAIATFSPRPGRHDPKGCGRTAKIVSSPQ